MLCHKNLEHRIWLSALQKLNTSISKHSPSLIKAELLSSIHLEAEDRRVVNVQALELDLCPSNAN